MSSGLPVRLLLLVVRFLSVGAVLVGLFIP